MSDEATLDKLASMGIATGDPVRASCDDSGGNNLSKTLRKAEGC